MTLGEKLRQIRQQRGLTQAEVAGEAITRNMLSLLEHDQAAASVKTLRYLSQRLGVPLSALLEEETREGNCLDAARACYLAGDDEGCLAALEDTALPLGEEAKLLLCRSSLRLGWEALAAGQLEEARRALERGRDMAAQAQYAGQAEGEEAARLALRLSLEEGRDDGALEAWEAALAPGERQRQRFLARYYLREGRLREAAQALRRSQGADGECQMLTGLLEAARGRHREAVESLQRALKQPLDVPDRKRCLSQLEQSALALEDYRLAYEARTAAEK